MDTTNLIANIKRITHVPTAQNTYTPTDFLALANTELQSGVVPLIIGVRENYYLTYKDFQASANNTYPIPTRAIGGKLAAVQMIVGNDVYKLAQLEVSQIINTENSSFGTLSFYVQGNDIILTPVLPSGVLRVYYYQRPNNLVELNQVGTITDISGNTVTVSALPSTFMVGKVCDFVKAKSGFQCLEIDASPTLINLNTVTFDSLPANLSVGDYLCLAEESPVAQIPEEFNPLLVQRTSVKILEGQGYNQKFQVAEMKMQQMEQDLLKLINPRVDGNNKKIVNTSGPLRTRRRFW